MPDLVQEAFAEAVAEITAWQEAHEEPLNWANYKKTTVGHLLKLQPFSRSDLNIGGGRGIVNATSEAHGPSWKMVVSLEQPVKAWGVFPGGQSGNPGSPFYDNMIDPWSQGAYYEMLLLQSPTEEPEKIMFTQYISPQ